MTQRRARAASFELEKLLTYRLWLLANRVALGAERTLARHGLTLPQWRVLAVLARHAPTGAADLAKRIALDKAAISRVLGQLVALGLVARAPHGEDRRREVLSLTDAGERRHARIVPLSRARQTRLLGAVAPRDRAALDRALEGLLAMASELLEETR
jgi:DNA-binding MarR family transcriptional regulator